MHETNVTESNTVTKAHYVMGVLGGGSLNSLGIVTEVRA